MKIFKQLGILCLSSILILSSCGKKDDNPDNPNPEPPTPTPQEQVNGKLELPTNSNLSVGTVEVYGDGSKVNVGSNGNFKTNGSTFVVTNKDNKVVYLNYASVGETSNKKEVVLNATETAVSMLIPVFPNVFTSLSEENFQSLRQLLEQLPETQTLAKAIEANITKNGYLNIDEVAVPHKQAVDKVKKLAGLDDTSNSNGRYASSHTSRKTPTVVKGTHRGIRLDVKEMKYSEEKGTWECTLTAYSDRLSYCSLVHAYEVTQNPDGTYNIQSDRSFGSEMKYILSPMSSSKFRKVFTTWSGIAKYFSDTKKLFTEDGFGFGDMTFDMTKTEDIKFEFTAPDQGIAVLTSKESRYLEMYNVATLVLTPVIKSIGKNIKTEAALVSFLKNYVTDLASDVEFVNNFALIADNTSLNKIDKWTQFSTLFYNKFKKHIVSSIKKEAGAIAKSYFISFMGEKATSVENLLDNISLLNKITLTFCDTFGQLFGIGNEESLFFEVKDLNFDFSVSKKDISLKEGDKTDVSIIGSGKYSINSNDSNIATVSIVKPGLFTIIAKKKGKTSIVVKDTQANKTLSINVTVTALPIPEGVVIEDGVLKKWPCNKIPSEGKVVIPNSVTEIGPTAFELCRELSAIEIPNSVNKIGAAAFRYCEALKSITIPSSVETIEINAFNGCSALTSVTIANGLRNIKDDAFANCSSLNNILLPNSVRNIGGSVFINCSSLTKIVIPDSVRNMGEGVFYSCSALESAKLSENVATIPGYTFVDCYSLKSVAFSSNLTSVGDYAFKNCKSLTTITFPKTISNISYYYSFSGCTNLKTVNIKATAPFSLTGILNYTNATVYVPEVSLEAYQNNNDSSFKDRIKALK
ncbi:leucine-rich repeat protein [Capnocytophaga bilenii]